MTTSLRTSIVPDRLHNHWSIEYKLLAVLLITAFIATPLLGNLLQAYIPLPYFTALVLTGSVYAALTLYYRQYRLGAGLAVIIFATFDADIPLAPRGPYPGDVVGELLLVTVPLALSLAYLVRDYTAGWRPNWRATIPLALFAIAASFPAIFGAAKYPRPVYWFVAYLIQATVLFLVGQWLLDRVLTLATLSAAVVGAVVGHAVIAIIQVLVQHSLGMSNLGEGAPKTLMSVQIPGLGVTPLSAHMAGFTGFSFVTAALAVIAIPLAIDFYCRDRQFLPVAVVPLLAIPIYISTSDAARGAAFVAIAAYAVFAFQRYSWPSLDRRNMVAGGCILLAVLVLAVPVAPVPDAGSTVDSGSSPGSHSSESVDQSKTSEKQVDIPLFSTKNLGVRFSQYVVGLDLWRLHPLIGIGALNFIHLGVQYGLPISKGSVTYPIHSLYIATLVSTGLVGFILFVSWELLTVWQPLRRGFEGRNPRIPVLAGLAGYCAFGVFDPLTLYYAQAFYPFVLLAGVVASSEAYNRRSSGD